MEDIHVGIWHRDGPTDFVPGDAQSARWRFEMNVRRDADGALYYGGPFVAGRRGERSLGLVWGTFAWNGFEVFRGAKLRLTDLEPGLVEEALETGARLVCKLGLTDEHGLPRCASVRPPDLIWTTA